MIQRTALFLLLSALLLRVGEAQPQRTVIIDADTGNEVDDLYAVVQGLIAPSWNVVGLNATQWQVSHWAVAQSMEESYRLNQVLLAYLGLNGQVRSNRGAEARLFDWGNLSQPSAASNFIIQHAHQATEDKVVVFALGALTNVASALLDDPSIASKIALYWLGSAYDFENGTMSNIDFNSVMDVQAVHVVLHSEVELHIIPVNVAAAMTFDWNETRDRLEGKHDLLDFLLQRWYDHLDGGRYQRTIWDLALIQAVLSPEMATEVQVRTSKERGDRDVWMYRSIDAEAMREAFFQSMLDHLGERE